MKKTLMLLMIAAFMSIAACVLPVRADNPIPVIEAQMSNFRWTQDGNAVYTIKAHGATDESYLTYEWFIKYKGGIFDLTDPSNYEKISAIGTEFGTNKSGDTFYINGITAEADGAELFVIVRDRTYETLVQSECVVIDTTGETSPPECWVTNPTAWTSYYNIDANPMVNATYKISWNVAQTESVSMSMAENFRYTWYRASLDNTHSASERLKSGIACWDSEATDPVIIITNPLMSEPYGAEREYYYCRVDYTINGKSSFSYSPIIQVDWDENGLEYEAPQPRVQGVQPQKSEYKTTMGCKLSEAGLMFRVSVAEMFGAPGGYSDYIYDYSRFTIIDEATGLKVNNFEKEGTYTVRAEYGEYKSEPFYIVSEAVTAPDATPTPSEEPATPTPTEEPATPTPTEEPATPTPTEVPATPTPTMEPTPTVTNTPTPFDTPTPEQGTPTPIQEEPTPTSEEVTPVPDEATPTPVQEKITPTSEAKNTPTPTLVPTNTPVPTASPTPVPGEAATKFNVPLVVTLVVVIALLAAAVGMLSTVIFMKKKYGDISKSGDTPKEADNNETQEQE